MSREDESSVGCKVRIKAGPFQDFTGTVVEIDKHRKLVKVKIDIFGRPEPAEFNFAEVATEA
jgi:transcription termination/antitermination protein NusG